MSVDPTPVGRVAEFEDRVPAHVRVADVDLVVVLADGDVSVLYGRCLHRGVLLGDGHIEGENLICGVHGWDYRYDTGISEYNPEEQLEKFTAWVENETVYVDATEVRSFAAEHPQPYGMPPEEGVSADPTFYGEATEVEPYTGYIQKLAQGGIEAVGHHGPVSAMGVPRAELPRWEDIQLLTAQLDRRPLADDAPVDTSLTIGPDAAQPLHLEIPILISDMSFGALSAEAKVAMAKGADAAGTAICSGEGGVLPEEQAATERYLYEYATGEFGWALEKTQDVQAFHFKAGQGAKTGTGGHLPGEKVTGQIAEVRELEPGTDAVSPSHFADLETPEDFAAIADAVRAESGGVPIGFKLSAQHIEADLGFAVEAGADYVILDGRGGGTGAAPDVFKQNISIPTIPAIARARRYLDSEVDGHVTLIATGGLRTESDFLKAMALGADGVAIANSAMQAIGCLGMRACDSNNCPVGIATQREGLRKRLVVDSAAGGLERFLTASTHLMQVLARACGHERLSGFSTTDLTSFDRDVARLTGIPYAGVTDN